jgi:hypothetical protein
MNQRILELARQVWPDPNTSHVNHEKFAELIVRECANELIKWKDEPFPYDPEFGARLIKQHFGVEL